MSFSLLCLCKSSKEVSISVWVLTLSKRMAPSPPLELKRGIHIGMGFDNTR
ncbi:protein of unknown function [Maridesulfovibrio hydrothermalis AM13 = DSM 14728]|uniref:Uncharacterized protein n=1 Tax=Maridesulfovibrio hydrothermalis AM13 = DSM 14728 TaxID=1121451 RepID=L0R5Y7_9BACT|nr:protein of unknown function [Maridesulfovibrio hydrothermalis AM13 = DSM 14728]